MKFKLRLSAGDDVRLIWAVALCVLLGGSFYVQQRYQSAISRANERIEIVYDRTAVESRTLRESSRLIAVERRAQTDLARVSHETSLSASTARLVGTLFASARSFHARVLELSPGLAQAAPPLDATPLTIRISGRFGDILAFVEDLSRHSTLISVSDTELAVENGKGGAGTGAPEPRLDATIHATLYRLHGMEKEMRVASNR